MTWATFRDTKRRPGRTHGSAAYYSAHEDTARVSYDVFRGRISRGWDQHAALVTPMTKQWSKVRDSVVALVCQRPNISRAEIADALGHGGSVASALDRLVTHGVLRCIEEERSGMRGQRIIVRRYRLNEYNPQPADAAEIAQERAWTPPPYVNPIRARYLGLPVAETERTREVRAGFVDRPGRAA